MPTNLTDILILTVDNENFALKNLNVFIIMFNGIWMTYGESSDNKYYLNIYFSWLLLFYISDHLLC